MTDINSNLWPFVEAKKILKRFNNIEKEYCIFQTGYGPSGLPHIGTFGEVLRTSMVIKAFKKLTDKQVKLFVFSDDMDGLRKVPKNIPNQTLISQHLEKPLSSIPDPFQEFESFPPTNCLENKGLILVWISEAVGPMFTYFSIMFKDVFKKLFKCPGYFSTCFFDTFNGI